MRISRNYKVEDWKALKFSAQSAKGDWHVAANIFLDRLETRYLEHIRHLLTRKTSGFVVLALDCALIETMEQFRRGTNETPQRRGLEYFQSFLTGTSFQTDFTAEAAKSFYKEIRCGLLHQSEAGGNSRIKRGDTYPLMSLTADHRGIVINKNRFHDKLEQVINEYANSIRDGSDVELRQAFRRKMNFICRTEAKDAIVDIGDEL